MTFNERYQVTKIFLAKLRHSATAITLGTIFVFIGGPIILFRLISVGHIPDGTSLFVRGIINYAWGVLLTIMAIIFSGVLWAAYRFISGTIILFYRECKLNWKHSVEALELKKKADQILASMPSSNPPGSSISSSNPTGSISPNNETKAQS